MIRRVTGIGTHNIKPFIFTNRCVRVLKEKITTQNNITETEVDHRTELISSGDKKLADLSFGKKTISNFFGDSPVETKENFSEKSPVPTNN